MTRPPRPKDSDDGRLAYLKEHVAYERRMLGYTFGMLSSTAPGDAWNAIYESFGIHARNLYDFLRNGGKPQTTFRADDYVPSRKMPPGLLTFNELDTFLFHMSTGRAEREKLNMARLTQLGAWIDMYWEEWVDLLPEPFAGILSKEPVCYPRNRELGVTDATACTVFTASTWASTPRQDGDSPRGRTLKPKADVPNGF